MIYTSANIELIDKSKTSARLISHKLVQNNINDYCNRPTSENPIVTIIKDDSAKWLIVYGDKDFELFWKIMDERLELCHRALQIRHKRLSKVTSDVAPILWQHGALARLDKGESIHDLLHNGYSTISLLSNHTSLASF